MIQQILHQSFVVTRTKLHSPCELSAEQSFMNGMRSTDMKIRILHNTEKLNEENGRKLLGKRKIGTTPNRQYQANNLKLITTD